ncbi:MAG: hypothetical protein R2748_23080 [Bryobacterales bacterium]
MGFLRDLKIAQKLALILCVTAVPVALLAYFLIAEQNAQVSNAARQEEGVAYLRPLRDILAKLPEA